MAQKSSAWTLIYIRGRGGKRTPIGQIHLRSETDMMRLKAIDLPDALVTMSKRARQWQMMFVDDSDLDGTTPVWAREAASDRFLEAIGGWLKVCEASDLNEDVALKLLHPHTLEDLCRCLLGRDAEVIADKIHTHEISLALSKRAATGARPPRLRGCR